MLKDELASAFIERQYCGAFMSCRRQALAAKHTRMSHLISITEIHVMAISFYLVFS